MDEEVMEEYWIPARLVVAFQEALAELHAATNDPGWASLERFAVERYSLAMHSLMVASRPLGAALDRGRM